MSVHTRIWGGMNCIHSQNGFKAKADLNNQMNDAVWDIIPHMYLQNIHVVEVLYRRRHIA